MSLLEAGDADRALVEFRNVFKLNPKHKEARLVYARTQLERGKLGDAYGQYLRLVEQYPDTLEARIELAEYSIKSRNWKEAERHGRPAQELAPDNPRVETIVTALDYAKAQQDGDPVKAAEMADLAREVLDNDAQNIIARRIVIDHELQLQNLDAALPLLEDGIAQEPRNAMLHEMLLRVQLLRDDTEGVGDALKRMVEVFPNDERASSGLIQWYMQQGDNAGAEAFLRELGDRPDAGSAGKLTVVQFIDMTRGRDAAMAELDALIASQEDPTIYQSLRASMVFEGGDQQEAVSYLDDVIESAPESPERNDAKIVLARMLLPMGNAVGARAHVEEVLQADPSHVEALKMRAAWLVDDDQPGAAIENLRAALAQEPRDPTIMTLMAAAHQRAGDRQLAGERLALAVELSNGGVQESIRYATFLLDDERFEAAEAVLADALTRNPNDLSLLRGQATLRMREKDWGTVQRLIWKIRAIDSAEAAQIANGLEAELLLRQERLEDTIDFLEKLAAAEGQDSLAPLAALVQTQVRAGNIDKAQDLVDERLKVSPADRGLLFLRAGLLILQGERREAETIYRALLDQMPGNDRILRVLYSILIADNRLEEADVLIDAQIAAAPNSLNARLLKAERLEKAQDYEGAIAIYEDLYTENSGNLLVANNLASLITTHRSDPESLERGFNIARRLRGTEVPALQDTYGWIEYRRGNYEEALSYLEPAAAGLPQDPLTQFHLGMTYVALEQTEKARATLTQAIALAEGSDLPQIEEARRILEELDG